MEPKAGDQVGPNRGRRRHGSLAVALVIYGIAAVATSCATSAGCSSNKSSRSPAPQYAPIVEHSPANGAEYCCRVTLTGDTFQSVLSGGPGAGRTLTLAGKAQCMALSAKGDLLTVAFIPMAGPNPAGHYYLADRHEVAFVDTATFQVVRRWAIRPPNMPAADRSGYRRPIERFDAIALSADGEKLVTYYWKPIARGRRSVITLWEATTGKPIRELMPPRADPSLSGTIHGEDASGLAISADGDWVALAGGWPIMDPRAAQPDGFVAIWRASDGSRTVFRTKGHLFHFGLRFDATATRLAGWDWVPGKGTSLAEMRVWRVPDGRLMDTKRVKGRILTIAPGGEPGTFRVKAK